MKMVNINKKYNNTNDMFDLETVKVMQHFTLVDTVVTKYTGRCRDPIPVAPAI